MLKHVCMDPQDPYAQEEVVVAFERTASDIRLVSAINAVGDNILDDLVEAQRRDLISELADADSIPRISLSYHHGSSVSQRWLFADVL